MAPTSATCEALLFGLSKKLMGMATTMAMREPGSQRASFLGQASITTTASTPNKTAWGLGLKPRLA